MGVTQLLQFIGIGDGYLPVQGVLISKFLDGLVLVNGITMDMPERYANGVGELAAQLICWMQQDGCTPNLMAPDPICGQEYEYVLIGDSMDKTLRIKVYSGPMTAFGTGVENLIFEGSVKAFSEWVIND